MKKQKSKRIVYIDVVKFLAIWMVCIGHSYPMIDMSYHSILYNCIYSFHMPLFMMLCVFFSLSSFDRFFVQFLKQKTIQLLFPVITISLLTILVCFFINYQDIKSIVRNETIGGMWFLRTLFFCYVYIYLVKRTGYHNFIVAAGSIVLALIFPHGYFLQFNWMLIFFWIGYFLRYYNEIYVKYQASVTLISLSVFILFGVHEVPKVLTYQVLFSTPWQLFSQFITGLSGSLSLFGCICYLCKCFNNDNVIIKKMAELGTYTLGIYGLQSIILQRLFISYLHFNTMFLPYWITDFIIVPLIGLFTVITCYYCILALKRVKIINLLMFGNQYN